MALRHVVRQAYRLYAIALVVWAGWSAVWIVGELGMAASTVGYVWLGIAAFGGVLTLGLGAMGLSDDRDLFLKRENRGRIRRFKDHLLSSTPLHLHVLAIAAWSALTVEWWVVNLGLVGRTIVAYGWFLIGLYGLGLATSLAVKHKEAIVEDVDEMTPSTLGSS